MKFGVILTNDWELQGNGGGDYFRIQKEPLLAILEVLEKYGARLTVFAEVVQQLNALKRVGNNAYLKSVSEDWEDTVLQLISSEHDVQLHIHPQLAYGKEKWSVASLRGEEMYELITECKDYLENLLRKVSPQYNCMAFRAGGYAIQPSGKVINNLLRAGIKCDSTVTKGLHGSFYDFRDAYSSIFPWFCRTDICHKSDEPDSLLEIPIFSVSKIDSPFMRRIFPALYYRFVFSQKLSSADKKWLKISSKENKDYSFKEKYSEQIRRSWFKFMKSKILQKSSLQFDYDKVPAMILVKEIEKIWNRLIFAAEERKEDFEGCYIPVVFIGHAKELRSTHNIERLLDLFSARFSGMFDYLTISDFCGSYGQNREEYERLDNYLKQKGVYI